MRLNTHTILLMVIMAVILPSVTWGATSYYLWDDWGETYSDAEKTASNTEDDLMCWAATASNILAWSGWGDVVGDADDIFAYYQDNWTDAGGNVFYGWDWWFTGENYMQGEDDWSQVDNDGGGFYTTSYNLRDYIFSDHRSSIEAMALGNIEWSLTNGYATALGLTDSDSGGHAVTCWGYEYELIDDLVTFLGIWITDSDDDKTGDTPDDELVYYAVNFSETDGVWYLENFYGTTNEWYIAEVQGLSAMPVPLPSALLTFGAGLALLSIAVRRQTSGLFQSPDLY